MFDVLCYYYNGFYYTQETVGDRGDYGYMELEMNSIIPLDDNKYEIEYYIVDVEPIIKGKSVIAMKESQDGFRFWSIYSIDTEEIDS